LTNGSVGIVFYDPQQIRIIRVSSVEGLCIFTFKGVVKTMKINGSLFGIACRAAALSFLVAGPASLVQAQQSLSADSTTKVPLLMASSTALDLTSSSASSSSSSTSDATADANGEFLFSAAAKNSLQPPPRRYGRPTYSNGHTNPDGSSKFAFMAGGGASLPMGNTKYYETPSYDFQVGVGRNWSKSLGVMAQFDYDHFGLQGATLANQQNLYNIIYYCSPADQQSGVCSTIADLEGSNHVWSFTLNPTFTLATEGSLGAYVVVGGGFYHKVTDFTIPSTQGYCDDYGDCYQYQANQVIDHYTSNAPGVNGGIGLTYKFSKFSNERFYMEARYVVVFNSQRTGYTIQNVNNTNTPNYPYWEDYPANSNRTTYIPVTVGIRF
jgi:hypothetical protein